MGCMESYWIILKSSFHHPTHNHLEQENLNFLGPHAEHSRKNSTPKDHMQNIKAPAHLCCYHPVPSLQTHKAPCYLPKHCLALCCFTPLCQHAISSFSLQHIASPRLGDFFPGICSSVKSIMNPHMEFSSIFYMFLLYLDIISIKTSLTLKNRKKKLQELPPWGVVWLLKPL